MASAWLPPPKQKPADAAPAGAPRAARILDVTGALFGLVLLLPALLALSALVAICDGRPVFFRQERVGRGGALFRIWKFRTMSRDAERRGPQVTSGGDGRVTRLGAVLRRFKLDELPQLLNVLCGDMSLCGPRPEVPVYVDCERPEWRAVLEVRPGITDLASILYCNEEQTLAGVADPMRYYRETLLPEKLRLNLRYLASRTVWNDLTLILVTVRYSFLPGRPDRARIERLLLKE